MAMKPTPLVSAMVACCAAGVLVVGTAPIANAASSRSFGYVCPISGGSLGVTFTVSSGGSSAKTAVNETWCTTQLGVRASYRRDQSQQVQFTEWVYTSKKTTNSVTTSPGNVAGGTHMYKRIDGEIVNSITT